MPRPRSAGGNRWVGLVVALAASAVVLFVGGCGGATKAARNGPTGRAGAGELGAEGASSSCTGEQSGTGPERIYCEFVLTDGRRFKCHGRRFQGSPPNARELSHDKACTSLSRLVTPAPSRTAVATLAKTRTCLGNARLRVTGGPIPPARVAPRGLEGELTVGNETGGAYIAFFADPHTAAHLESALIHTARRFGGQVERRGAVTLVWYPPPPSALRGSVQACAFS